MSDEPDDPEGPPEQDEPQQRKPKRFGQAEKYRYLQLIAQGYGVKMAAVEIGVHRFTVYKALQADPIFAAAVHSAKEEQRELVAEQKEQFGPMALMALSRSLAAPKCNPLLILFALQNAYPQDFQDRRTITAEFKTIDEQKAYLEKVTGMPLEKMLPDMKAETKH